MINIAKIISVVKSLLVNYYTKNQIDSLVISGVYWKAPVDTYADLTTTYPTPEEGWTVSVSDTNEVYRYNAVAPDVGWLRIDSGALATTEVAGRIEIATSAEVTAGTDSTRAVVPSTLKTELDKKEDDLGNPSINGQMLVSTTTGVRSWATPPTGGGGGGADIEGLFHMQDQG